MKLDTLRQWVGRIGWVNPAKHVKTAAVAVKVSGARISYGRHELKVEPLAGVGYWWTTYTNVDFDRGN